MSTPGRSSVGRYELRERLGAGGMGTVWRAWDPSLQRDVAIKEVLLPQGMDPEARAEAHARTLREAQATARISNTAVVTVHDVLEHDDSPWIVMELLSGASLQSHLDEHGPMPVERVEEAARSLLSGLKAAHAAGVTHRDIKPANVMLTDDDRTVLTDFGIANVDGGAALTQTGVYIGSPEYMAPERFEGKRALPASDLWSLGVTLYALLEGRSPFKRESITGIITAVLTSPMPPRLSLDDGPHSPGSGPMRALIGALLNRDAEARPDPDEALALLEREKRAQGRGGDAGTGPRDAHGTGPRNAVGHSPADPSDGGWPTSHGTGPRAPEPTPNAPWHGGPGDLGGPNHPPLPPHQSGPNGPMAPGVPSTGPNRPVNPVPHNPAAVPGPVPGPVPGAYRPTGPQAVPQHGVSGQATGRFSPTGGQPTSRAPLPGPQAGPPGPPAPPGPQVRQGHQGPFPGPVGAPVSGGQGSWGPAKPGRPTMSAPWSVITSTVLLGLNAGYMLVLAVLFTVEVAGGTAEVGWGSVTLQYLWGLVSAAAAVGVMTRSRIVYGAVVLLQLVVSVLLVFTLFSVVVYAPDYLLFYGLMLVFNLVVVGLLLVPPRSRAYFGFGAGVR
ncbi:serine/threonine-protein kinase [Nocardiopsis halotolerans]|uniref:serine/threonine-protein kinase n=1 Tax=Nocardiopsis halotolerans TaxID=124252 RepID=UPI0003487F2F|nr:serine/threonine-protein kinase [Nocardiopsis halotolerans]